MREDDTPTSTTQPRRRVLIAEDDPSTACAIKRVLSSAGYETTVAGDGFLAGSLLLTFRPSVMTLDLGMPCLDGLDVLDFLQRLREPLRMSACRVLVVSAASPYRVAQALSMGAHDAMRKPFVDDVLLHQVTCLFGGKRPACTALN